MATTNNNSNEKWFLIALTKQGVCISPTKFKTKEEAEELAKQCVNDGVWQHYKVLTSKKKTVTLWEVLKLVFATFLKNMKTTASL